MWDNFLKGVSSWFKVSGAVKKFNNNNFNLIFFILITQLILINIASLAESFYNYALLCNGPLADLSLPDVEKY